MADTIESLAARLHRLEDLEAIRAVIAAYGPLADSGRAEELAALWAEDGTYAIEGYGTASGRCEIAVLIGDADHRALMADGCAHLLGPVAIELAGDRAIARGHSVVFRHCDGEFIAYRVAANRGSLERRADGWCVTHRENALLDGQETARALLSPQAAPRPR